MLCAVTSFVTCAHDPTSSYTQKPASDEAGVVDRANQACFLFCFVFVVPACPLKEMQNEISPNVSPLWTIFSRPFLPTAHLKCWLSVQRFGSNRLEARVFFCFFFFFPCLTLKAHTLLCNTIDWNKHGKGDEHSRVHFVLSAYLICKYHMPTTTNPPPLFHVSLSISCQHSQKGEDRTHFIWS